MFQLFPEQALKHYWVDHVDFSMGFSYIAQSFSDYVSVLEGLVLQQPVCRQTEDNGLCLPEDTGIPSHT